MFDTFLVDYVYAFLNWNKVFKQNHWPDLLNEILWALLHRVAD